MYSNAKLTASLLRSSVSHDPSEIILICWFAAQESFLIIILLFSMLKTVVVVPIFTETMHFFHDSLMIESLKEQHVFETEIFCNIMSLLSLLINLMHPYC